MQVSHLVQNGLGQTHLLNKVWTVLTKNGHDGSSCALTNDIWGLGSNGQGIDKCLRVSLSDFSQEEIDRVLNIW